MKLACVSLIAVLLITSVGCAEKKKPSAAHIAIPAPCLKRARILKESECTIKQRGKMRCNNVEVDYVPECEEIVVNK